MKKKLVLYHGTSSRNVDSIRKEGLVPRKGAGNYGKENRSHKLVYLTKYYPAYFAINALKKKGDFPAIVRVEVRLSDLLPDEDFLSLAIFHSDKLKWRRQYPKKDDIDIIRKIGTETDPKKYAHLAEQSLGRMGNCATERVLKEQVTHVEILPTTSILDLGWLGADSNYSAIALGGISGFMGHRYGEVLEDLFFPGFKGALDKARKEQEALMEEMKKAHDMGVKKKK